MSAVFMGPSVRRWRQADGVVHVHAREPWDGRLNNLIYPAWLGNNVLRAAPQRH